MASMGFNPFARHTENQPSKPNDQGKSASVPKPQITIAGNAAETEQRPPARPVEKKPASAAHANRTFNPFASHGKKQFRLVRKDKTPPAQKLLDWIRDWPHPFIGLREIVLYGPNSIRNRDHAIRLAETLVGHGWLTPVACRRDTKVWKIIRGPSGYPIVADLPVNVATNVAAVGE
jgi:hypothetical protein